MEVEVRAVGGSRGCFVALPVHVIQALDRTAGGSLPAVLALHLRAAAGQWRVAWSGAASRSAAVEVPQELADCISLPDQTRAQLSVSSFLAKAESVCIEPISEDDWEIVERRAELAEETILKQVGIVYEGMKFPLWLDGHNIVKFLVVSSSPNLPVVQLVPGTEVAVAPKKRKEKEISYQDVQNHSSMTEQTRTKSLLRVQVAEKKYVHTFKYMGIELGVVFTYAVLIHPDTAANLSFNNLQLVTVMPKLSPKETVQNGKEFGQQKGVLVPNKERSRHITVHVLLSDSVAKGHIMLSQSLCRFIRADGRAWVYVRKYSASAKKDLPTMTISPVQFKMLEKKADDKSELDNHEQDTNWRNSSISSDNSTFLKGIMMRSLLHEFNNVIANANDESASKLKQEKSFIKSWLIGQLNGIASQLGQTKLNSVILPTEALLHFEVIDQTIGSRNDAVELLYLLTISFENSDNGDWHHNFDLHLDTETDGLDSLEPALGKLELGEPISLDSPMSTNLNKYFGPTLSSLSWMEAAVSDIAKRLSVLLSPISLKLFSRLDCPLPGHVLIYGPRGCGKTALGRAAAKYFEEHKKILAHTVYVDCSMLALEKSKKVTQAIADRISEALVHAPSVVVFDDLDNIISSSSESQLFQSSSSDNSIVKYLTDIMDEYRDKSRNLCGYGPIAFVASAKSLGNLPQALTSSGRFDFHIQLSPLAAPQRSAILKHEVSKRDLQCSEEVLFDIASKCDGCDAYDLDILVDRAVHAGAGRFFHSHNPDLACKDSVLLKKDFLKAMDGFLPVAMRDIRKIDLDGKRGGWEDVGGLTEIVNVIRETVELPSKYPNIFAKAPLRSRSNILLYGPPGCGKTHIVGATAAACSLRFISVSGPELLNKYIGASEQAVRDLFAKAVAAAPCLLFFDEFESIAPKRGHDNTGVTDRVVNQFLTELDGVEALTGVFVFAATSRPDYIDAALLRPGRFDRLLFVDFPQRNDRLDILRVLSRKVHLASDVNLEEIADLTEGFNGANLQFLLTEAELAAINEYLDSKENDISERPPVISGKIVKSLASKIRPSVSEDERRKLDEIYSQFSNSKKSISSQARDSKGKRVTLA